MQISECVGCQTRYIRQSELASCPKCKSREFVRMSEVVQPLQNLNEEDYMDLWRFAYPGMERFNEILENANASKLWECPKCACVGPSMHMEGCIIGKLQRIETVCRDRGLVAGTVSIYKCGKCTGQVETLKVHAGVVPHSIKCVASMGCKGMMDTLTQEIYNPEVSQPELEWRRPTVVSDDMTEAILVQGELVLFRRAKPEDV